MSLTICDRCGKTTCDPVELCRECADTKSIYSAEDVAAECERERKRAAGKVRHWLSWNRLDMQEAGIPSMTRSAEALSDAIERGDA